MTRSERRARTRARWQALRRGAHRGVALDDRHTTGALTTKDALIDYGVTQGWLADRRAGDAWLRDRWYRVTVRGHAIPVVPLYGFKRPLILHDIHHLVTGYATDLWGEMAIAGWELGSGGCVRYPVFWLDRLSFFLGALVLMPTLALHAFGNGRKRRNLYRFDPEDLLSQPIEAIRTYVAGQQEIGCARAPVRRVP